MVTVEDLSWTYYGVKPDCYEQSILDGMKVVRDHGQVGFHPIAK